MPADRPADRPAARNPALLWSGMAILYVVWGSTYLGIAIAIETIPPFFMAAGRFVAAGSIMLVIAALVTRGHVQLPSRREWLDSAIVGALLLGGGMGLVSWGEQTIPSGIAALMIAMMPVWIAILSRVFLGQRLPRLAVAGIVIGFAGVAVLIGPAGSATEQLDPAGALAIMISPLSWSLGSLYAANRARLPKQPLVGTGAQMLAGSVVLFVIGLLGGEVGAFRPEAISTESLVAVAYLTLIGSVLAFTTYGWLLRTAPLPLIATYAYVNPVVAVFLGWLVLGEPITGRTVLAGGIIIFAVALIVTTRNRMSRPAEARPAPDLDRLAGEAVPDAGHAVPATASAIDA